MNLLEYVALEDVKAHLQLTEDDCHHDEHLRNLIHAASAMVKNHLGSKSVYLATLYDDDEPLLDSNFEPIPESFGEVAIPDQVRPEVRMATLILVGELFRNREGEGNFTHGMLPPPVSAILYPLRDPQLK